jgi:heme/copper-type cytochrome/quinol oxidase subunit 1
MSFDELPLLAKILIGLIAPPIVTVLCWLIGPRLAGASRERRRERNWVEFWLMLIAAYLVFSLALWGRQFFSTNDRVDPSSQLVQ